MSTATATSTAAPLIADARYPQAAPQRIPDAAPAPAGQPGLTAAELEHFHARGWVLKRGLFDAARIAALSTEIDGLHERCAREEVPGAWVSWEEDLDESKPKRIRQLMGSQAVSPLIDAMSRSEEMLSVLRQVIGPDVYLFHSKLMMKAAHDGSFTPWHQDFQYWQGESKLPTQVNCMLSIDGSDEANGCLRMVDGSHHRGLLPIHRLKSSSFSLGLAGGLDDFPSTSIHTEPGDAIFFGAYVIHGSGPNGSDRHRRANTFAFDRPGNVLRDGGALPREFHRCGARDPLSA